MKLFQTPKSMFAEITAMEQAEFDRREDRATVSAFYAGKPPWTQDEIEKLGLQVNVNNLFGYNELAANKTATFSLYHKPARLLEISLDSAPVGKKEKWEKTAARSVNRIIKKSNRLKKNYEGVAGDATMHGEGMFYFPDTTDWCPKHLALSKRLIPNDAASDAAELHYWAIETELSISQIWNYYKRACPGWKKDNLKKIIDSFREDALQADNDARVLYDQFNPEEWEELRQTNSTIDKIFRTGVRVYYFYQIDPEAFNRPVQLCILAKTMSLGTNTAPDPNADTELVLFDNDSYYSNVREAIHPFFMDTMIGGQQKWHRVLGLGHLNYSIDWHVESLLSRVLNATFESLQTFWNASDPSAREEMEQVLLKHNGIIPDGVKLLPDRVPADLASALAVFSQFRQQGSINARGIAMPTGQQQQDLLETQAVFQQNQAANQAGGRTSNWYDYLDDMLEVIFGRFTNELIQPRDAGYSEICEFQQDMEREGIPLYYLQSHNVTVRATRITGDGQRDKEMQTAGFLTQNMQMVPPEKQPEAKRLVFGIMTDDYDLAERLIPLDDKPDSHQVMRAESENNTAIIQGKTPPLQPDDIDSIHIQNHLGAMSSLIQKASQMQQAAFTPDQALAFRSIGGHAAAHIQKAESMGEKDLAAAGMDGLRKLAAMGDKLVHNMEQMQQAKGGEGEELDPAKKAELELKTQQLDLQKQKLAHTIQKGATQQQLKDQQASVAMNLAQHQDIRAEEAHRAELASNDLATATAIRNGGANESQ